MRLGYVTNGFAHHRIEDAAAILSEIGYTSVAITLDRDLLNPPDRRGAAGAIARIRPMLSETGLSATIETGARYILDPRRKHQPTLISASPKDRMQRIEMIQAAIDIAAGVGADSVSLWSGARDDEATHDEQFSRLVASLREVLNHAEAEGVRLSFEPEPGMLIATMSDFVRLHESLAHPLLGLTIDVGHVHCLRDGNIAEHVERWRDVLWNVHVEDMRRDVHEHLTFGDGDLDFDAVFEAFRRIDYAGPVHVELSRHSHDAPTVAQRSFDFLQRFV